jgi:alpha-1,3-glucosyltransferase
MKKKVFWPPSQATSGLFISSCQWLPIIPYFRFYFDPQVFIRVQLTFNSNVSHFIYYFLILEYLIKVLLFFFSLIYAFFSLKYQHRQLFQMRPIHLLFLFGIVSIELYNNTVHHLFALNERFPYLPLMLTSVFSALGVFFCWLEFLYLTLSKG